MPTLANYLPHISHRESLLIILSGQYGLLIVVVGAVLPVVETFADPNSYMFEVSSASVTAAVSVVVGLLLLLLL